MLFIIFLFIIIILFLITVHIYFYLEKKIDERIINKINNYFKDNEYLNNYTLFGTHNSLTYKIKNIFSPFAKTQNYNLEMQLKKNIRYFDLRFKIENNNLEGYHNFVKLNIDHKEVFNTFIKFLNENPNEFIIIVLKNEEYKNHEDIFIFLYNYIKENNLENYFHFNNLDWDYIPLIKDIKKKIYILNFIRKNNNDVYYLPWNDNQTFTRGALTISDCYKISSYEKIKLYKNFKKNLNQEKINIFYFSSEYEYKYIFGLFFYNKLFNKQIKYNFSNLPTNKNIIYVFDFIDIHQKLFNF